MENPKLWLIKTKFPHFHNSFTRIFLDSDKDTRFQLHVDSRGFDTSGFVSVSIEGNKFGNPYQSFVARGSYSKRDTNSSDIETGELPTIELDS